MSKGPPSLLFAAIEDDDETLLDQAIALGVDLNTIDVSGNTALYYAALGNHVPIMVMLLQHGANPNLVVADGCTPLIGAAWGNTAAVRALLELGADVNQAENSGMTALMWAAHGGHAGVIETLLRHGADVNARDNHGFTALMYAAAHGLATPVKLLLAAPGVHANARNKAGESAFDLASLYAGQNVEQALIDRAAERNRELYDGAYEIHSEHYTAEDGSTVVAVRLVDGRDCSTNWEKGTQFDEIVTLLKAKMDG